MRVEYGQIWMADLSPTVANEQGGYRPVVVTSGRHLNNLPISHAIVVAVTSRSRGLSHHLPLGQGTGLVKPSWAMAETTRVVSTTRFDGRIGWADASTMEELANWLEIFTRP